VPALALAWSMDERSAEVEPEYESMLAEVKKGDIEKSRPELSGHRTRAWRLGGGLGWGLMKTWRLGQVEAEMRRARRWDTMAV
jgi:hypothetical protein